jgi:large subunit ribosomal protein L11
MATKIGYIRLQVPAGKATPSPPIGPALGQRGLNIMEFCKQFNARTQDMEAGIPVPVIITAFSDRRFTFIIKTPPVSYLLKKAAGIEKGTQTPGRTAIGQLTHLQIQQIAEQKRADMNAIDLKGAIHMIAGSARSMGIEIVE